MRWAIYQTTMNPIVPYSHLILIIDYLKGSWNVSFICVLFKDGIYEALQCPWSPSSSVMYSQWRAVAIWALEMDISLDFFSGAFTFCSHLSLETGYLFRMSMNYQYLGLGWLFVYLQTAVFTSKMTSPEGQDSKLPKAKNIFEPQRVKQTFSGMKRSILAEAPRSGTRASLKRSIPLAVWRMHTLAPLEHCCKRPRSTSCQEDGWQACATA